MKKLFLLPLVGLFCATIHSAQAQSITSTLGWGWFVEGVSPVTNTFAVTQPPNGSVAALFVLNGADGKTITFKPDAKFSNGITADFDMGAATPGSKVAVYFLSLTNDTLGSSVKELQIIPKSRWLQDATISSVKVTGKSITMKAVYPISALSNGIIPTDVTAIGGKSFGLNSNLLEFGISYSIEDRTSIVSSPALTFNLNILDQKLTLQKFDLPDTNVSLDTDFELALVAKAHTETKPYEIKFSKARLHLSPMFSASFDAGLSLYGRLAGQIYYGQLGDDWGFIERGDNSTRVTATLYGKGYVRGGIELLFGLGSAYARLEALGRIGGGFQYESLPKDTVTNLFGGDIAINGWVDIETFWGLGPDWSFGPKNFLTKSFGKLPSSIVSSVHEEATAIRATTFKVPEDVVTSHPQPAIFSYDNRIGLNWIKSTGTEGELLVSILNEQKNSLSNPISILKNRNSISEPHSAFYRDGSILTVWTQNTFTEVTLPTTATIEDIFAGQDIKASYYNKATGLVSLLPTLSQANIADGKPSVAVRRSDDQAVILWLSRSNNENTVRYTAINKLSGNLELSESEILATGANKDPHISFFNDDKALAVWINDPDNNEETSNDRILGAVWNGLEWTTPQTIVAAEGNIALKDLAFDASNAINGITYIRTKYGENGTFVQSVEGIIGQIENHEFNDQWLEITRFSQSDSLAHFQQPTISLNAKHWASVGYQYIPMAQDTIRPSQGEIRLMTVNLNETSPQWKSITANDKIGNQLNFVWSLNTAMTDNDNLYLFTQEKDTVGGSASDYGKQVGNGALNLVLRTVKLSSSGEIIDVEEPDVTTGISAEKSEENHCGLTNYPNPFALSTTFEFSLKATERVVLKIKDVQGNTVATVIDKMLSDGKYQAVFQPGNLPSDIYFAEIAIGNTTQTRKVVLQR